MSQYVRYPNPSSVPSGGTANQLLGENAAGTALEFKTLSGTVSQIVVTNGVGSITLSTPQNIATTSSPTFSGLSLNGNLLFPSGSDIGQSGANRPANIYTSGNVVTGGSLLVGTDLTVTGTTTFTNPILAPSGNAAAPGISFSVQSSMGLYRVGAGEMGLTSSGAAGISLIQTKFTKTGNTGTYVDFDAQGASRLEMTSGGVIVSLKCGASPKFTFVGEDTGAGNLYGPLLINSTYSAVNNHITWQADGGGDIGQSGANRPNNAYIKLNNVVGGKVLTTGGLGVGNSAAATLPGLVTKKIEVFDASGASLGFIAVYDAIT